MRSFLPYLITASVFMSLAGLWIAGIGAIGLATRRPLLMHGRLLWVPLVLVAAAMLSFLAYSVPPLLWTLRGEAGLSRGAMLNGAILVAATLGMLVAAGRASRGYIVYGVTDETFRDGLFHALRSLGEPFEERLSAVRLTARDTELLVNVQASFATGQLQLKRGNAAVLAPIADLMRRYFASARDAQSPRTGNLMFVLMGLVGAGSSVGAIVYFTQLAQRLFPT